MLGAIEFEAVIGEDHVIHVPRDVPVGRVRVIVLIDESQAEHLAAMAAERRTLVEKYRGKIAISDDFDDPLSPELRR